MDRRSMELLMRRMETGPSRGNFDVESRRRRRRSDGTFMTSDREIEYENTDARGRYEHSEQGERNTDVQNRAYAHKGPDDPNRRRIGFTEGKAQHKSHWAEEEFVGDMEESLYHEVDDITHYLEIMKKVYKKGYEDLAYAFYEIANEKFVCAEFLKHQLRKIGSYNPSEHKELEEDLEEVKEMFKEI